MFIRKAGAQGKRCGLVGCGGVYIGQIDAHIGGSRLIMCYGALAGLLQQLGYIGYGKAGNGSIGKGRRVVDGNAELGMYASR